LLSPHRFYQAQNAQKKLVFGQGSAPDSAGELTTLPRPPSRLGRGIPSPFPSPPSAPRYSTPSAFRAPRLCGRVLLETFLGPAFSCPLPSPSLDPTRGLGSAVSSLSGSRQSPAAKRFLVRVISLSLKIQISCSNGSHVFVRININFNER